MRFICLYFLIFCMNINYDINTWAENYQINRDLNPVIISAQTSLDGYRLKNFYITNLFQGLVWMIFHFSVIFFFGFLLQNIALVWFFLGFANLIAFWIDIPLGILQRYIPTRRLFLIAAISQLIATSIFFAFIFKLFWLLHTLGSVVPSESIQAGNDWFFGSVINYIWVIIASICYGITKEINDISTYGYILSHADPSDYGTILARNNITFGIGSLLGLLLSWIVLSFSPAFAVVFLAVIIVIFMIFTIRYFDTSVDSVSISDITHFKLSVQKWNSENVKEYIVETIKKADIEKVIKNAKYLMLKPKQKLINEKIPWTEILITSKKEFMIIWKIFLNKPLNVSLIWTITLVLIFGFWDTFATSFLLGFLHDLKPGSSYILLAIIWVPWILLQEVASKIGSRIWPKIIGIIGLFLSAWSLILMGIFSFGELNIYILLPLALINSLGYACGMSTGQNQFLDTYNRTYAQQAGLAEINANASSGPIKVVQNLANVFGLVIWGSLLYFGFSTFFIIFWITITVVLLWTLANQKQILL